jgi:hypothetical protein
MHSSKLEHAVQQLRDVLRKEASRVDMHPMDAEKESVMVPPLAVPQRWESSVFRHLYSRSETATEGSSVLRALLEEEGSKYG